MNIPPVHDAEVCETCVEANCDGEGCIPGTQELCCHCPAHVDPAILKAERDDALYDQRRDDADAR